MLTDILEVFSEVGGWIGGAFNQLMPIFYGPDGLTLLGILSIAGLSFSIVFLLLGIIQRFLRFGA